MIRAIALASILFVASCGRATETDEVVLYSSVDRVYMEQILLPDLESRTGLTIRYLGDNEANKTTGLVVRLLSEQTAPRADVWWSSEPFGTIRLADEGVLSPVTDLNIPDSLASVSDRDGRWFAFAARARVIAFGPAIDDPPTSLADLASPEWEGRIGMARPEFGTTRGHMAFLLHEWGEDQYRSWLGAMKANGLRLYDGNGAVVRAIRAGEIDVGLTDTDDVYAAQRNEWPVNMVFERTDDAPRWRSAGPLTFPNTAGLVEGGPNPEAARRLLEAIVAPETERLLAESDSRNTPLFPQVAESFPELTPEEAARPDLADVAARVEDAVRIAAEVLGG